MIDPRDLGALDSDAAHQSLLVEDEGVDVTLDRDRREILGDRGVDDHEARSNGDLPAVALVEVVRAASVIKNMAWPNVCTPAWKPYEAATLR
jgi:hypothetical protein